MQGRAVSLVLLLLLAPLSGCLGDDASPSTSTDDGRVALQVGHLLEWN